MSSLWPEDIGTPADIRAPITVLKEQAAYLGRKTNNYVEATVYILESREYWAKSTEDIKLGFFIVASSLGNYRYRLFTAAHSLIQLYPVRLKLDEEVADEIAFPLSEGERDKTIRSVSSEKELLEILAQIFSSKKTRRVVQSILAQLGVQPTKEAPPPEI